MALYFFDVLDGERFIVDEEGQDLPNVEAARMECVKGARELIAFAAKEGIDATHRVFRVRVATLPFRETLTRR